MAGTCRSRIPSGGHVALRRRLCVSARGVDSGRKRSRSRRKGRGMGGVARHQESWTNLRHALSRPLGDRLNRRAESHRSITLSYKPRSNRGGRPMAKASNLVPNWRVRDMPSIPHAQFFHVGGQPTAVGAYSDEEWLPTLAPPRKRHHYGVLQYARFCASTCAGAQRPARCSVTTAPPRPIAKGQSSSPARPIVG
jgi:hypothetical protein